MPLFNRQVELTIGQAGETGIQIKNLRVVFEVKKTSKKQPNSCAISVYNLSENTRSKLINLGDLLILKVGYADEAGVQNIFAGNLTFINHAREGADIVTKLECEDGEKALRETKVKLTYAAGTSAKQVLKDLVAAFPLAAYFIDEANLDNSEFVNGFAFTGTFTDAIDKIADKLGFEWSIQDNELQILAIDNFNKEPVISLSQDSGMIGRPENLLDVSKKAKKSKKKQHSGWRVKTLCIPRFKIGGKVVVSSVEVGQNVAFRIDAIKHSGDTHGDDWTSEIDVTEL